MTTTMTTTFGVCLPSLIFRISRKLRRRRSGITSAGRCLYARI